VPIALHIWVESVAGFNPSFSHTVRSIFGSICACVPTAPSDFTNTNPLASLGETFFRAADSSIHQRKLQTERDGLGMHAVAAPDHRSF